MAIYLVFAGNYESVSVSFPCHRFSTVSNKRFRYVSNLEVYRFYFVSNNRFHFVSNNRYRTVSGGLPGGILGSERFQTVSDTFSVSFRVRFWSVARPRFSIKRNRHVSVSFPKTFPNRFRATYHRSDFVSDNRFRYVSDITTCVLWKLNGNCENVSVGD